MAITFAFLSASGGVGKTTLALHVAYKFLLEGKDVLLIDVDPSAGLSTALLGEAKVEELGTKRRTLGDALEEFLKGERVEPGKYVERVAISNEKCGDRSLDLIPSGDALSDAMGLAWFSGSRPSPENLLKDFLEKSGVSGRYEVVILDTIPFYERRYTLTALQAADKAIAVTHPYGVEPARSRRMFLKLKEIYGDALDIKIRVLINKVDVRTKEGREAFKTIEEALAGLPKFQTTISNLISYTRIKKMEFCKDKKARKEIDELYEELMQWLGASIHLDSMPIDRSLLG
ncbi:MAG: ParA family protein [Thermoproteus sp. AZ2]|jgi:chromosome partitioning protein|uniref:ParA family protein n=1 Tax=Thermoproteus sp. AZ2 TaxID=1609232 RepID=A0ACC6V0T7_9CREN|nr:MAG: chromosome partitioning protein ParA [Thermoproteus sp. AZ2]